MKRGTDNSTASGANNGTREDVVRELKSSKNPLSTSDLSSRLDKAWHTIDRTCLMLQIDGVVEGFKVGKMNLWRMK